MEKLIFRNTKYRHNGIIYEKIRKELQRRSSLRGETMAFNVSQLRNKLKKCVGDCKKVALTIKTATGIKRSRETKAMGLGLINCLLLSRLEIHVNQKVQQNLLPTKMIMKRLVKMMMMTTLLLRQRKYMYQFDPKKIKRGNKSRHYQKLLVW